MKSGIYSITCLINNKKYIGYATNLQKRKGNHFDDLRDNKHRNNHLQNAYNLYKKENFLFEIVEYCRVADLCILEHYWAHFYDVWDRDKGYNIDKTNPDGKAKRSEETCKKIGDAHRGKFVTDETKEKISKSKKGQTHTKEAKDKIGIGAKGRVFSKESLERRANTRSIPIIQLSKNEEFIKEWKSAKEASECLDINHRNISSTCRKERKTAGKFIWKFIIKN